MFDAIAGICVIGPRRVGRVLRLAEPVRGLRLARLQVETCAAILPVSTALPDIAMQTETFELEGDYIELNQLLKLSGQCGSGGAGKLLVASGVVKVDGAQELRKTAKIRGVQGGAIGSVRIEQLKTWISISLCILMLFIVLWPLPVTPKSAVLNRSPGTKRFPKKPQKIVHFLLAFLCQLFAAFKSVSVPAKRR